MEIKDFVLGDDCVTLVFENAEVNLIRDEAVDHAIADYYMTGCFEFVLEYNATQPLLNGGDQ